MGSDTLLVGKISTNIQFQSTLPAWGATNPLVSRILAVQFQSTLPAWGATLVGLR